MTMRELLDRQSRIHADLKGIVDAPAGTDGDLSDEQETRAADLQAQMAKVKRLIDVQADIDEAERRMTEAERLRQQAEAELEVAKRGIEAMVLGKVPVGSRVTYAGRSLRPTPYGSVVLGIGRDATGPLHIGHTRWAALGDAMVRLLRAAGAQVAAEYYINDAGGQVERLGGSVLAKLRGEPAPEGGYDGEYVVALADAGAHSEVQLAWHREGVTPLIRNFAGLLRGAFAEG